MSKTKAKGVNVLHPTDVEHSGPAQPGEIIAGRAIWGDRVPKLPFTTYWVAWAEPQNARMAPATAKHDIRIFVTPCAREMANPRLTAPACGFRRSRPRLPTDIRGLIAAEAVPIPGV